MFEAVPRRRLTRESHPSPKGTAWPWGALRFPRGPLFFGLIGSNLPRLCASPPERPSFHFEAVGRAAGARFSSAIFSSARKSERHQLAVESRWSQYIACRGELVEMERTRCDPRAKPRGKRPPSAQRWRRMQTIPKSANIMHACGMRGQRWRGDASLSTFLT
jgi:hypothetical protein